MTKGSASIELRHLRYFIAAAEHGSFRKAGVALGIHESAVSRRIRDLEDRIGASLFLRHSGGVCLTFAGQRFLGRARGAITHIGEGARDMASIGRSEEGWIRVGIFSSIASGFLADLLREYNPDHSGVRIDIIDGDPKEHIAAIRQFQIDVVFITGTRNWPNCDSIHLRSERVFVVLPETHELTGPEELDWNDSPTRHSPLATSHQGRRYMTIWCNGRQISAIVPKSGRNMSAETISSHWSG